VFFGKVYMVKAGMFKDVDACLSWHSDTETNARYNGSTAVDTVRVRFRAKGRQNPIRQLKQFESNLEFLRSLLPSDHGISEPAIIKGGGRPGLNPDVVEAWYSLRTFDRPSVEALFDKVKAIADFQAKIMGAEAAVQRVNGVYPRLPIETLVKLVDRNLREYWPPRFTAEEKEFGRRLQEEFRKENPDFSAPAPLHDGVLAPPIEEPKPAGNDNGDVS
jgi:aminobenzoyl-glutamate utilization protein B